MFYPFPDKDECASSPCQYDGTCQDVVDGYICLCNHGYTGVLCETDVNECSSLPCMHSANCTDIVNGYLCTCAYGYTGDHCETGLYGINNNN